MNIVPFKAEHLERMELQSAQRFLTNPVEVGKPLEGGYAFTAFDGDKVLACAGIVPLWQGRAAVWSYLSKNLKPRQMVTVHRETLKAIEARPEDRIEATCDADWIPGHRWLRMLGFRMESARMSRYRPDGGDEALYARVRHG